MFSEIKFYPFHGVICQNSENTEVCISLNRMAARWIDPRLPEENELLTLFVPSKVLLQVAPLFYFLGRNNV